mmetsp:Transcript_85946/g.199830  ORF Transcript_85946/g.199830 Transcript_85946/m.199830 type:complete len:236 (+) Transcript_85946:834-1541(+)
MNVDLPAIVHVELAACLAHSAAMEQDSGLVGSVRVHQNLRSAAHADGRHQRPLPTSGLLHAFRRQHWNPGGDDWLAPPLLPIHALQGLTPDSLPTLLLLLFLCRTLVRSKQLEARVEAGVARADFGRCPRGSGVTSVGALAQSLSGNKLFPFECIFKVNGPHVLPLEHVINVDGSHTLVLLELRIGVWTTMVAVHRSMAAVHPIMSDATAGPSEAIRLFQSRHNHGALGLTMRSS